MQFDFIYRHHLTPQYFFSPTVLPTFFPLLPTFTFLRVYDVKGQFVGTSSLLLLSGS